MLDALKDGQFKSVVDASITLCTFDVLDPMQHSAEPQPDFTAPAAIVRNGQVYGGNTHVCATQADNLTTQVWLLNTPKLHSRVTGATVF